MGFRRRQEGEKGGETYVPFRLELLQANEGLRYRLIGEDGLVLLKRAVAYLGVLGLGHGVLEEGLLKLVERHEDAEDLRERVLEIALGAVLGELYFLGGASGGETRVWDVRVSAW